MVRTYKIVKSYMDKTKFVREKQKYEAFMLEEKKRARSHNRTSVVNRSFTDDH